MTFQEACKIAYGPHFQVPKPAHGVEPPIAAQDKVRRKLRDLKIEEAELTELLSTNRALQLQYESQLIPF